MKRDEERILDKSYPADFENKELAGRSVKLAVKITKIKEKKLPALDDELAQDVSEKYKTLADLKADIRSHLEKRLADKLKQLEEKALVDGLLARSKVGAPRVHGRRRARDAAREPQAADGHRHGRQAGPLPLLFRQDRESPSSQEWRPSAEKSITTRLAIEKLVEEGKYECAEADLEAEFARQAAESSLSIDEVKAEYEKRGSMDYLRDRIKEDKLMADLLAAAKVTEGRQAGLRGLAQGF